MDDKAALEDIRNGGQEGCKVLRKRYELRLCNYVAKYLPKKLVKNVVQKGFAQFEKGIQYFNQASDISTELYRIIDNAIDEVAIKDIRHGNREGYTIVYRHYVNSLINYVRGKYHLPKYGAEEVVQNVFLEVYKSIMRFEGRSSLKTWLSRITDNVVYDWLEKEQKQPKKSQILNGSDEDGEIEESEVVAHNELDDKMCLEKVKILLKNEGNIYLLECLEAHRLESEGFSKQEIGEKIERTTGATKQFLSTCRKKLVQYPPLQECQGIFIKMCLEDIKADLERNGSNDTEILNCLQAYLLKLSEKPTSEIGRTNRKTRDYLSECKEKLMQHSAVSEECRKWLTYLE